MRLFGASCASMSGSEMIRPMRMLCLENIRNVKIEIHHRHVDSGVTVVL